MVSKSPKWGYSPCKWPKWLENRGDPNHFLTGTILQAGALGWIPDLCLSIYLEPVCPLFWGERTLQKKAEKLQSKWCCHLGYRYIYNVYIYIYWIFFGPRNLTHPVKTNTTPNMNWLSFLRTSQVQQLWCVLPLRL